MSADPVSFHSKHFSIVPLADGVFAAIAATGGWAISNAGIVDLGERTLVFDTFMTPEAGRDLREAARQLTGRDPELIVNSHYHNDHTWGNQSFAPQALFIATTQTLRLMQTAGLEEIEWARRVSAARLQDAQQQLRTARDEAARRDAQLWAGYFGGLLQSMPGLRVRLPDMTFDRRLELHGSRRSVELVAFDNTHTGNDTIMLLRDEGIGFMADLLFVNSHPYLDEADPMVLRLVLDELRGAGLSVLVPGHGAPGDLEDLASNMHYIDTCLEAARRLVAAGDISQERIAREAPPSPFEDWSLRRFYTANLESLCAKLAGKPAS